YLFKDFAKQAIHSHGEARGPRQPYSLSVNLKRMKVLGYGRLVTLLKDDKPGEFATRVLTACQWAGRAMVEERKEEAFLRFAIALESLILGTKNETEITYRLRLRCANLIDSTPAQRAKTQTRLTALYKVRSAIVHSGKYIVNDNDLSDLQRYV